MTSRQAKQVKAAAVEKIQTKSAGAQAMEADIEELDVEGEGIQDLLEVLALVEAVAELIIETVADGISPLDLFSVLRDKEVRQAVGPAFDDVGDIGAEIADLSGAETKRLFRRLTDFGFNLYETVTDELL